MPRTPPRSTGSLRRPPKHAEPSPPPRRRSPRHRRGSRIAQAGRRAGAGSERGCAGGHSGTIACRYSLAGSSAQARGRGRLGLCAFPLRLVRRTHRPTLQFPRTSMTVVPATTFWSANAICRSGDPGRPGKPGGERRRQNPDGEAACSLAKSGKSRACFVHGLCMDRACSVHRFRLLPGGLPATRLATVPRG